MLIPAPAQPPLAVIGPYLNERPNSSRRPASARLLTGIVLFCLFYGFAFALFAPQLARRLRGSLDRTGRFRRLGPPGLCPRAHCGPGAIALCFHDRPDRLAKLPGDRPAGAALDNTHPRGGEATSFLLFFLVCVSTSKEFRATVASALASRPLLWKMLAVFVSLQFLSIGLSESPFHSIEPFVVFQINCTSIFFVSCYVFSKPGRVERWAVTLWAMAVLVGLVGIVEGLKGRSCGPATFPDFFRSRTSMSPDT